MTLTWALWLQQDLVRYFLADIVHAQIDLPLDIVKPLKNSTRLHSQKPLGTVKNKSVFARLYSTVHKF